MTMRLSEMDKAHLRLQRELKREEIENIRLDKKERETEEIKAKREKEQNLLKQGNQMNEVFFQRRHNSQQRFY